MQRTMFRKLHPGGRTMPGVRLLRASMRNRDGGAALEFGIVAPIFLMLLVGIFQFGFTLGNYMFLTNAAVAGAQTLSISRGTTNPFSSTTTAILAAAPSLTTASIGITMTVNGTACTSDTGCATTLSGSTLKPAVVRVTYPCNLTIVGVNYVPGCTLTSQVAQMVQ